MELWHHYTAAGGELIRGETLEKKKKKKKIHEEDEKDARRTGYMLLS